MGLSPLTSAEGVLHLMGDHVEGAAGVLDTGTRPAGWDGMSSPRGLGAVRAGPRGRLARAEGAGDVVEVRAAADGVAAVGVDDLPGDPG